MHFVSAKGQASCTDCPTTNETGSIGCCPGNSDQWPLERGFSCLGRRYGVFLDTVNLRQFFEYVQCCKTLSGNKNIHVDIQAAGFWGLWLCAHFGFDVFHCWFVDQSFPSRIFQDEFTPWQECQCDACAEHWLPGGGQTELTFSDLFVSIVQKKKEANQQFDYMTYLWWSKPKMLITVYDISMMICEDDECDWQSYFDYHPEVPILHDLSGTGGSNSYWAALEVGVPGLHWYVATSSIKSFRGSFFSLSQLIQLYSVQ